MKNVLYLSYDGLTDPLGQSQILPYVIGLTKAGYRFTIISFEKKDRFAKGRSLIERICAENNIDWQPLSYTKHPPVLSTLRDIFVLRKAAAKIIRQKKVAIVHCRSYITALTGLMLKKLFGVKMIFDMRGFWADERVDGGLWRMSNPLYKTMYKFFKKKEIEFLQTADYTISLTEDAKKEIESWPELKAKRSPIQVIPCCVDLELFNPSGVAVDDVNALRTGLRIPAGATVLSYIGSIGTWYLLEEMLDFFLVYQRTYPGAVMLFVTKEDNTAIYEACAKKGIAGEAVRITESDRAQVPAYIACSTHSLFFIKPSYSKKASSPTKQGEIMAMGIPVICNEHVGDTSYVVEHYQSGKVISAFSNEHYVSVLQDLKQTVFDKEAIRSGARQFYSLDTGVEKYRNVYESLHA